MAPLISPKISRDTNELIEMLMRFRTHDVVVSGDITKAFLMLEVGEADGIISDFYGMIRMAI